MVAGGGIPSDSDGGAPAPRFHLAIFDDCLRSVPLADGTLVIGRSKGSHLQIHDGILSRKHCSLTVQGPQLTLVDLNSSNGTYVNGRRIATQVLEPDDIIELGRTVLVVYDGSAWRRGSGLLNLRNPVKAQELVQRLGTGAGGLPHPAESVAPGAPLNGARRRRGVAAGDRTLADWLLKERRGLLEELARGYLHHKLVSQLMRRSPALRAALGTVLDSLLERGAFADVASAAELDRKIAAVLAEGFEQTSADVPSTTSSTGSSTALSAGLSTAPSTAQSSSGPLSAAASAGLSAPPAGRQA